MFHLALTSQDSSLTCLTSQSKRWRTWVAPSSRGDLKIERRRCGAPIWSSNQAGSEGVGRCGGRERRGLTQALARQIEALTVGTDYEIQSLRETAKQVEHD